MTTTPQSPAGQGLVESLDRMTTGAGIGSLQSRRLAPAPALPSIPARVGTVFAGQPATTP